MVALLICSCSTQNKKAEKQVVPIHITAAPEHEHMHENSPSSLEDMTLEELLLLNRNLSNRLRNDYRFWSSSEPDRWPTLADNFADNVICSCPEASTQKKEIAQFYLTYLEKRTKVVNSEVKNKQALMSQLSTEFRYNLSFLIGIEGYQKWESESKPQTAGFSQMRDSLYAIIALSDKKYKELIKQQKP